MPTPSPRRHTAVLAAVFLALVTGVFAWTARGSSAAARPPAQATAVATIDISELFAKLDEKADIEARLQSDLQTRQAGIDELVERGKRLQGDLETLGEGNQKDRREKVRELLELRAQLDARQKALQQIISIEKAQIFRDMYNKVATTIKVVAERDGFDVVMLDNSAGQLPAAEIGENSMINFILSMGVVYTHPSADITDRVATQMNNDYRANPTRP